MPETHGFGRLYVHSAHLRADSGRFHRAPTTEIEPPFRVGTGLVVRVLGEHGFVIGWWTDSVPEDVAMEMAIRARREDVFGEHGTLLGRYRRDDGGEYPDGEGAGAAVRPGVGGQPEGRAGAAGDAGASPWAS